MREIKFRGKAIMSIEELELMGIEHDSGWVYGNLIKNGNRPMITADILEEIDESIYPEWWVVVEPESVGQYTGMKDKNGTPIYEGDIVTGESFETSMLKHWKTGLLKHLDYEVEYVPEMYVIKYHEASFKTFNSKGNWVAVLNHHVSSEVKDLQVIGNVFENPELMEVERNE